MTPNIDPNKNKQPKVDYLNIQRNGKTYSIAAPTSKPSRKWGVIAALFSFLTIAPVILYLVIMFSLIKMAQDGVAGTEFMAFAVAPLLSVSAVFLVVDSILAIIYLVKRKPHGKKLILPIAVLVITAVVAAWFGWAVYYDSSGRATKDYYQERTISTAEAIRRINNCEVISVRKGRDLIPPSIKPSGSAEWESYESYIAKEDLAEVDKAARNAPEHCGNVSSSKTTDGGLLYRALTIEKATELINACEVQGFYYPGSSIEDDSTAARQAYDKTGIVLVSDMDNEPIRIHTSPATIEQLAPTARKAQASCPNLQFWNGRYEQRDENGNWY